MHPHRTLAIVLASLFLAAGCGSSGKQQAKPETAATQASPKASPAQTGRIPAASGPLLSIDGDYPYTIQGIMGGTIPVKEGEPAPAGQLYAAIVVEVKGKLQDRPLPAPNLPLILQWPGCTAKGCFSTPLERPRNYVPTSEADNSEAEAEAADSAQQLAPGVGHLATVITLIPQKIELKQITMCTSDVAGPKKQCIPLGSLPPLPK
ncbi:hypothetical protein [Actinomadura roseirufa]|uniref:hypothetical protein n=1 Tax=Actinomadura roseirufa TaxID=2094049 RepID=UPI00104126C8|nr:hypothetical protein [Actinomadura roseirufa]